MRNPTKHLTRKRKLSLASILELSILGGLAVILLVIGGIVLWATLIPIPSINNFESRAIAQSTKIYDRTGTKVLYDVHGSVRRTYVNLDQINPYVRQATIAIEDRTFYENVGFQPLSIARAIIANITSAKYSQGASTITQQVVKNALLTQEKTITRKIEEIILAVRLTRVYTKDQILNTYLNESSYGGTIYGVEEASQYFFGVHAQDVSLAQAAYLAALPQAPTYYSPSGNHRESLDNRKNLVLAKMYEQGYISKEDMENAQQEQVVFRKESDSAIKAPHFVFYIQEYLETKYGTDAVTNGGLHVVTTLDYELQQTAEAIVKQYAPEMQREFNASNTGTVVIDPKTGQILAMVGSRDYFDDSIDGQVNVTLAHRQPGSSFKPFVYAAAFAEGYTPQTVVFDTQTQFSTACSPADTTNNKAPCYSPQNYDGSFKGPMTLRNALAQSQNVPAVKTLYLVGLTDAITTARSLGITTLGNPNRYGLTLVLGGGEVTLLEMTGAYAVFANEGIKNTPTGILEVRDSSDQVLEKFTPQPTQILDVNVARQISDVLSDNVARTPEFGANSPLNFPGIDVADKTGTTNDSRDAWIIGYTTSIAVGSWAGNNNNTPMIKKIAAFIVAPMWHAIMQEALKKYPPATFTTPTPLPSDLPPVLTGNWNTDPERGVHDILYWIKKDNPRAGEPTNHWSDSQSTYWDYGVQAWLATNGASLGIAPVSTPGATSTDTTNTHLGISGFTITSPKNGMIISSLSPFTILGMGPDSDIDQVIYTINGSVVGTTHGSPYATTVSRLSPGPQTLTASVILKNGSVITKTVQFVVQ